MRKSLLILLLAALLGGCGTADKMPSELHALLKATREKAVADEGNPSPMVDVKVFYFQDEEVVARQCRGFIMDTRQPFLNNVGILLGTTDRNLLTQPFVASFPTEADKPAFTCIVFPKHVHVFDRTTDHDTECYILSTAVSADSRPAVTPKGRYDTHIQPYLFALSTTQTEE